MTDVGYHASHEQFAPGDLVDYVERAEEATLYTLPDTSPPLVGAALSEQTARWLGRWADGMVTIATPNHERLERRIEAFREQAPDAPVYLEVQLSYDEDEQSALDGAYEQWRTNCVPGPVTENLRTTEQFDTVGETVSREQVKKNVRVSADVEQHVEWLQQDLSLDVQKLFLHNVNRKQEQFIDTFGDSVLPELEL